VTETVRSLVLASAALALGDDGLLRRELSRAALQVEMEAVEEMLLQSCLFLGYPAALRGLAEWRRIGGPAPLADGEQGRGGDWAARGEATCRRVYGAQYERLRENIRVLHPEMERWMLEDGYGRVLGRPGLDLATRELCVVALLAPQDAAPQLYSHLRGAMHAGAGEASVAAVVALLGPLLPAERRNALEAQWSAVRQRRAGVES
jgi:4-carboxymuconolactone decarboxylase